MRSSLRDVPPRQLWGAVARRGARIASRALGLGRMRPDPLPAEAGARFLIEKKRLAASARAVATFHPGAARDTLAEARRILDGEVELFGRRMRAPRGDSWHRDPLTGQAWPTAPVAARELLRPGRDARATWELGRLGHLVTLGRARCLAELGGLPAEPDLADSCVRAVAVTVADFAASCPPGRGVHWAVAMEAALRVVNLGLALHLVRGHPALPAGFEARLVGLAADHGAFILENLEDGGISPNNHLAADYLGLLAAGALVGCADWRRIGVEGLVRELARQVLPDGGSFEASVPYHRLAAEIFLAGAVLAARTGAPFPSAAQRRLREMVRFAGSVAWPDGTAPQVGDDDASRVLPLAARGPLELAWLGSLGAALFGCADLAPPGPPAEEALWIFGPQPRGRWKTPPVPISVFPDSGLCLLRGGGTQVLFRFGQSGQGGRGGHAHNDLLSVQVHAGGKLLVADPGTLTYAADPSARNELRSSRSHATVMVDGLEQAPLRLDRLFLLPGPVAPLVAAERDARGVRAAAELATGPYRHRRALTLCARSGALLIEDLVAGAGVHEVELRFPEGDEEMVLRPAAEHEQRRVEDRWGPGWIWDQVAALGPPGDPRALVVIAAPEAAWRLELAPAVRSAGYGRARAARALRLWACGPLPLVLRSVVVVVHRGGWR